MTPARLEALRAMARQDESPNERDIARAKLQEAGHGWDEPPRRPPAAPAPSAPWPPSFGARMTTTTAAGSFTQGTFYIRFTFRDGD